MSRRTEIAPGVFRGRRAREAYLTMLQGRDKQLTLYRENVIEDTTQDPAHVTAARDDDPIIKTATELAPRSVTIDDPLNPSKKVTVSGAVIMAALSEMFDQLDDERIEQRRQQARAMAEAAKAAAAEGASS